MTKINTLILLSLLVISCLKPIVKREIVPVNIPPDPCEIPFPPENPSFHKVPYDCDGPGPETVVCMLEPDFVTTVVWIKKYIAWAEIVRACENVKFSKEWGIRPPEAVETPVVESRI